MAYDVTGKQKFVLRGGVGLFYDRPSGNSIYAQVQNPPSTRNVTVRYGTLQDARQRAVRDRRRARRCRCSSTRADCRRPSQWNVGVQMMLPWATSLDVEYVGQHTRTTSSSSVNLNAIDFGAAFPAQNQDRRSARRRPGRSAVTDRPDAADPGYGNVNMQMSRGWVTYHSLQLSFQRRFQNGLSFGFNDTIGLSSTGSVGARLQHTADGTFTMRDDQAQAEELLQQDPVRHTMQGELHVGSAGPEERSGSALRALGFVVNDWQLSGIWTGIDRLGLHRRLQLPERRRQREPDRLARLRRARAHRRRSGRRAAAATRTSQFNTSAFQGPLVQQRRPRVGPGLPAGLLHERARPRDRGGDSLQVMMGDSMARHRSGDVPLAPVSLRSVACQ